jgi:pimeloyl-ACP methyl ester carboxylesterase
MQEHAVEIGSGAVRLSGALTLPEAAGADRRAVLFLSGSGPIDRDENMPDQRLDIFNTMARHFAGLGIASLRYDKRGCGHSAGDYLSAGQDDFLADAAAALRYLREALPDRRICLLGHSEGTLLAARLSLEHPVDGLVLLAPFVAKIEDILMHQASQIEKEARGARRLSGLINRALAALGLSPRASQRRLIDKLRSTSVPVLRHGGRSIEARSLRDLLALDPAEIYASVTTPILLIAGEKDLQCDPRDAQRIAQIAGPRATAAIIPDLTHILRRDPGPPSFASCAALVSQPMDEGVIRLAGDWIAAF